VVIHLVDFQAMMVEARVVTQDNLVQLILEEAAVAVFMDKLVAMVLLEL
jgi:hypothetical protein